MVSEHYDVDHPEPEDKPKPPYQKTGKLQPGWRIAAGHDNTAGLIALPAWFLGYDPRYPDGAE